MFSPRSHPWKTIVSQIFDTWKDECLQLSVGTKPDCERYGPGKPGSAWSPSTLSVRSRIFPRAFSLMRTGSSSSKLLSSPAKVPTDTRLTVLGMDLSSGAFSDVGLPGEEVLRLSDRMRRMSFTALLSVKVDKFSNLRCDWIMA